MMRSKSWPFLIFAGFAAFPLSAASQDAAVLCVESGACASVEPMTALIIVGVRALVDEVNKGDEAFGPNGVVIHAVNTVLGDLQNGGLGPTNDLVKAWETVRNDLTNGMGENNDIIRFLSSLEISL